MLSIQGRGNILLVDDQVENLHLLLDILESQGYECRPCRSGLDALMAAESTPPELILLDINMPQMDGYEVCRRLKARPGLTQIPVIFISALGDVESKVKGFGFGAVDFITKPFRAEEVLARVSTHITLSRCQCELSAKNEVLQSMVDDQVRDILDARKDLELAQLAIMRAMSKVAEARDDDTGKHIDRVSEYCRHLATAMRDSGRWGKVVSQSFIDDLYHASPLHDIGKVAIPDAILFKPGKLTPEEFNVMKSHAEIGARTLEGVREEFPRIQFIAVAVNTARHHHERWDGKGYPAGLAEEEIPLAARIMAIADVYDALRAKRCYKEAFSHEKAHGIMVEESGKAFDPALIALFIEQSATFEAIHDRIHPDVEDTPPNDDGKSSGAPPPTASGNGSEKSDAANGGSRVAARSGSTISMSG